MAERGLALENQGDVDVQAIAGAVSTGTHGTGPTLGSISTQLVGLRIVTADGDILECTSEADEVFRAAQAVLGAPVAVRKNGWRACVGGIYCRAVCALRAASVGERPPALVRRATEDVP